MLQYAIVEIAGKQYLASPDKPFLVNFLGDLKSLECDKVLLKSEGEKIEFGNPYLNYKLKFEVMEKVKGAKIRVATYKAKANTRKVRGSKPLFSKIKLIA